MSFRVGLSVQTGHASSARWLAKFARQCRYNDMRVRERKLSAILMAIAFFAATVGLPAGTLTTPSFRITIEVRCPKGY
jgi:hypothetical protein